MKSMVSPSCDSAIGRRSPSLIGRRACGEYVDARRRYIGEFCKVRVKLIESSKQPEPELVRLALDLSPKLGFEYEPATLHI